LMPFAARKFFWPRVPTHQLVRNSSCGP
jgi:hypothetical protein